VLSLIGHGVAMADFGGGIPDHCHNKAVANRISHGGRYWHGRAVTDIGDIQNISKNCWQRSLKELMKKKGGG